MGQPFQASTSRPAYVAMSHALEQAYGRPTTTAGVGGSIPLCNVLNQTFPDAEIILTGAEEPKCQMHAPNESVDPAEIERLALAEGPAAAARGLVPELQKLMASDDAREGLASFLERRQGRFTGR